MVKKLLLLLEDPLFLSQHWSNGLRVSSWPVPEGLTPFQFTDKGPTLFCLSLLCWYGPVPDLVSTFEPAASSSVKLVSDCLEWYLQATQLPAFWICIKEKSEIISLKLFFCLKTICKVWDLTWQISKGFENLSLISCGFGSPIFEIMASVQLSIVHCKHKEMRA